MGDSLHKTGDFYSYLPHILLIKIILGIIPIALQNVALQILKFAIACPESRLGVNNDHTF